MCNGSLEARGIMKLFVLMSLPAGRYMLCARRKDRMGDFIAGLISCD